MSPFFAKKGDWFVTIILPCLQVPNSDKPPCSKCFSARFKTSTWIVDTSAKSVNLRQCWHAKSCAEVYLFGTSSSIDRRLLLTTSKEWSVNAEMRYLRMIMISYNGTTWTLNCDVFESDTILAVSVKKVVKCNLKSCKVERIERRMKVEDDRKNKYRHRNKCGININTQCNGRRDQRRKGR